jgi:hypothetical protein
MNEPVVVTDDSLDDLFREVLVELRKRQWRRDNPYVLDLIETLWSSGSQGMLRASVISSLERARRAKGLPIPDTFEQTVQSAFNQHCIGSAVFRKRNAPSDGLFSSMRVGNAAHWIIERGPAAGWLACRKMNP